MNRDELELAHLAKRWHSAFVVVMSCVVRWSFYGFRYAARPLGMSLSPTMNDACRTGNGRGSLGDPA